MSETSLTTALAPAPPVDPDRTLLGVASVGAILIAGVIVAYVGYWRSRTIAGQVWRLTLKPWKFIVDATSVALYLQRDL